MADFAVAIGLVLVIEGLLYAAAPQTMRRIAAEAVKMPASSLRRGGLVALAIGVLIVWLIRG